MNKIETKICTKCLDDLPLDSFGFRNKDKTKLQTNCKKCKQKYVETHYIKNKQDYIKRSIKRRLKVKDELRCFIITYLKKNPCITCGEGDIRVLEFDHRVSSEKRGDISRMIANGVSLKTLINEIYKCDVLCANCHRKKTNSQLNWFKNNAD